MSDAPLGFAAPKRFYAVVAAEPFREGFAIKLDGRTAHTPKGAALAVPTLPLAELVAEEWRGQGASILYTAMPSTRLTHTAIDGVVTTRDATIDSVARFGAGDLLCYFAKEPHSLVARQEASWRPLLDWAREDRGLAFETTAGIVHRQQDPATLERLKGIIRQADDFTLAGLAFAAALFGSAILALALHAGRIDAAQAIAAARLDDIFQEERWGVDVETVGRTEALITDAIMLEAWFKALG